MIPKLEMEEYLHRSRDRKRVQEIVINRLRKNRQTDGLLRNGRVEVGDVGEKE